jgi:hypothetical protein
MLKAYLCYMLLTKVQSGKQACHQQAGQQSARCGSSPIPAAALTEAKQPMSPENFSLFAAPRFWFKAFAACLMCEVTSRLIARVARYQC